MTIQEAIERLEVHKGWGYREGTMTALDMAISALKAIQQYREIGTAEECREAVEKQKPMKATDIHVDEYFCPACGAENCCDQGIARDRYCPNCGQAVLQENKDD